MSISIPETLRLKPCPPGGQGVHKFVFHASCRCVEAGLTNEQAIPIIESLMTRPPNPSSEIRDALQSARGERRVPSRRWSPLNRDAQMAICREGPSLRDLIDRSPWPVDPAEDVYTEQVIEKLFPGNPWLCVGWTSSRFQTKRRMEFTEPLDSASLIVPSPMSDQKGMKKDGSGLSYHTEANTGPRRFLVVEFDGHVDLDNQAALLWHLATYAPLTMVVFSGSKSCHGWFFCEGQDEDLLSRFFDYAVSLGADDRMWKKSQFARMPDGHRADRKHSDALEIAGVFVVPAGHQPVLYFNEATIK